MVPWPPGAHRHRPKRHRSPSPRPVPAPRLFILVQITSSRSAAPATSFRALFPALSACSPPGTPVATPDPRCFSPPASAMHPLLHAGRRILFAVCPPQVAPPRHGAGQPLPSFLIRRPSLPRSICPRPRRAPVPPFTPTLPYAALASRALCTLLLFFVVSSHRRCVSFYSPFYTRFSRRSLPPLRSVLPVYRLSCRTSIWGCNFTLDSNEIPI